MDDSLLLGSPEIDAQHRALLATLDKLKSTSQSKYPEEALSDALSDFGSQIFQHFVSEEALMSQLAIPAPLQSEHRKAHERILEELTQIHFDAMDGKTTDLPDIIAAVSTWIKRHVIEFDLGLKPYIVDKNSSPRSAEVPGDRMATEMPRSS